MWRSPLRRGHRAADRRPEPFRRQTARRGNRAALLRCAVLPADVGAVHAGGPAARGCGDDRSAAMESLRLCREQSAQVDRPVRVAEGAAANAHVPFGGKWLRRLPELLLRRGWRSTHRGILPFFHDLFRGRVRRLPSAAAQADTAPAESIMAWWPRGQSRASRASWPSAASTARTHAEAGA